MSVRIISISKPCIPDGPDTAEELIAYCARVSNPANQMNTETAPRLLAYLARNKHWSPFEMVSLTMEIVTTRDIARQILRHRSFSFQEFSQRYAAVVADPVFSEARLQDAKNRQASIETTDAQLQFWWLGEQQAIARHSASIYEQALQRGMAKEVARKVLPEGLTESTIYMAGTARSWIHYLQIRTEAGTQKEHREVADACKDAFLGHFPTLSEVFQ